jgi:hypothetical protein
MDQDALNKQGCEQLHLIPQDTRAEQPLAEVAIMDHTIFTPEAEMDIDLPHLQGTEQLESASRKKIRTEIPDSEEASEASSPVKNDRDEERRRDEAVELDNLQMDQEVPEQIFDQEDTPKAERKMARAKISDSEEAFEFSSPSKVGVGLGESRDEDAQTTGGPEASGERKLQEIENGGTTVMSFSAPELTEGIPDGSRSDTEQDHELDRTWKSGNDKMELVETMKKMEYTTEKGESSKSISEHDGTGQQTLSLDNEDAPSADTSPTPAQAKELNSDTSHAEANGGVILHEAPQNKGSAGPMATFAQVPLGSPATHAEVIAAAPQRLLGEWSYTWFYLLSEV